MTQAEQLAQCPAHSSEKGPQISVIAANRHSKLGHEECYYGPQPNTQWTLLVASPLNYKQYRDADKEP